MFTPSTRRSRHASPKKHVDRREERVPTLKSASICVDGADMMIVCTVRDIHSSGARLSVMSMEGVPENFLLISRSENLVAKSKVAWKKGNEIGVRFLRAGDMLQEDQFRRERQYNYQKECQLAVQQQQQQQQQAELMVRQQAEEEARQQAQIRFEQMQVLGMDPTQPYTEDDLKKAYRIQAMQNHPDQGGDPAVFQQINDIYQIMLAEFAALSAAQAPATEA